MNDGGVSIQCIDYANAPPRIFSSSNDKCDCVVCVTHECQCDHLIKLRGGFRVSDFDVRHFRRSKVVGSLNGWQPSTEDASSRALLGEAEVTSTNPSNESLVCGN